MCQLNYNKKHFFRGDYYYNQQSYLRFEPKSGSLNRDGRDVKSWKSTRVHGDRKGTDLFPVTNSSSVYPKRLNKNNRLEVTLAGNMLKPNGTAYTYGVGMNI